MTILAPGPLGLLAPQEEPTPHGGGGPGVAVEGEPDPLDLLLTELEALPDRRAVLARLTHGAPVAAKRGRSRPQAFAARVARPYAAGVPRPLFISEYPEHWPRFKALWDRLPMVRQEAAAG
jgi:hypothetical protein